MILYFILIATMILLIDFVVLWGLQGFSFKDFKNKLIDTTYWQKKYNTAENELEIQRKAQLQDDLDMLDNRIDKAIEYIKEHIKHEHDGYNFYSYHLYDFNKDYLLNLLQGKSDE